MARLTDEPLMDQWIAELEDCHNQCKVDPVGHLEYLLKGLTLESPDVAVQFLQRHKDNGIEKLPELKSLIDVLCNQLLSKNQIGQLERLLELSGVWCVSVNRAIHQELARLYFRTGNHEKAYRTYQTLLKREPRNMEVLRGLYGLAKEGGRTEEAHSLLNRLVEVDPCPATVSFAYKERARIPSDEGQPVRIALLSSYVLDQWIPYLDFECRKVNLTPTFYLAPFNQYAQKILDPSSSLYQFKPEIIFIALALEDLFPEISGYPSVEELDRASKEIIDRMLSLVRELHQRCSSLIVLHDFALMHRSPHGILDNRNPNGLTRWIEDLNHALASELHSQERAYLLPLNQLLGWVGKERSKNIKMQYLASMRISETGLAELARYSMRYVKPLKGLTRKCVVVDLDGTLWGGIVGEIGPEGIHLGPTAPGVEYINFQQALHNLTKRGILLAVCSKNNPEDALSVIRNHKYMVLREEHFSAIRINWHNKVENIREIAKELNIGLDSMVFIDDSPAERELIRQLLPEVLTVELPTDPSRYRMVLEELSDFELLAVTKEDETRTAQYQAIRKRQTQQRSTATLDEYLRSLQITAKITLADPAFQQRLVQMFNKTNQFNLTTIRYQAAEISNFLESEEHMVYALEVSDRFGDHGLVGVAIIHEKDQRWRIDSLLLSCRVMGLSVETAFLQRIYYDAREAGVKTLIGEFIPTKKNQPTKDFYSQHGFRLTDGTDGHQIWVLDVITGTVEQPTWIETTGISARYDSRTNHRQGI